MSRWCSLIFIIIFLPVSPIYSASYVDAEYMYIMWFMYRKTLCSKRLLGFPKYESNHYTCDVLDKLTFNHFLNFKAIRLLFYPQYSESCSNSGRNRITFPGVYADCHSALDMSLRSLNGPRGLYTHVKHLACVYPINAERFLQHLLSERLRLSA